MTTAPKTNFSSINIRITTKSALSSTVVQFFPPTSTPSLLALMPSQQWPAVMTVSAATRDPPHIRDPPTPRVSMIWGRGKLSKDVRAIEQNKTNQGDKLESKFLSKIKVAHGIVGGQEVIIWPGEGTPPWRRPLLRRSCLLPWKVEVHSSQHLFVSCNHCVKTIHLSSQKQFLLSKKVGNATSPTWTRGWRRPCGRSSWRRRRPQGPAGGQLSWWVRRRADWTAGGWGGLYRYTLRVEITPTSWLL